MTDIFDNQILCKKCNVRMKKIKIVKNGFLLRAMMCPKCHAKIIHPLDEQEYSKFINLKNKTFHVKMRLVGNSYAVSIPKEIVLFIREQNQKFFTPSLKDIKQEQEKIMHNMVRLCLDDIGRLSVNFTEGNDE